MAWLAQLSIAPHHNVSTAPGNSEIRSSDSYWLKQCEQTDLNIKIIFLLKTRKKAVNNKSYILLRIFSCNIHNKMWMLSLICNTQTYGLVEFTRGMPKPDKILASRILIIPGSH